MARKNDRHPVTQGWSAFLVTIGGISLLAGVSDGDWSWLLFGTGTTLLGATIWFAGGKPMLCQFEGAQTRRSCENSTGGVLRGCHHHRWLKIAALLQIAGLPYPYQRRPLALGEKPLPERLLTLNLVVVVLVVMVLASVLAIIGFLNIDLESVNKSTVGH
jgi:hypothetical protein